MAAYDGEVCFNAECASGRAGYTLLAKGFICSWGGAPPVVTFYHKRAWDVTTSAYVFWTATSPDCAYGGGDTLDPPLGTVLSQGSV